MKKKILIASAMISSMAVAVPPNLGPPITTGGTGNTSSTEVRITANVVKGIAVNEASPIDFGNLAKGMYEGKVSQNTPGRITLKGSAGDKINLKLNKETADLIWVGANGTDQDDTGNSSKVAIEDVQVIGLLASTETEETLDSNGEASRILTAEFTAGKGEAQNLGSKQKLGAYLGSVIVTATKK